MQSESDKKEKQESLPLHHLVSTSVHYLGLPTVKFWQISYWCVFKVHVSFTLSLHKFAPFIICIGLKN